MRGRHRRGACVGYPKKSGRMLVRMPVVMRNGVGRIMPGMGRMLLAVGIAGFTGR